jgi:hypothetical protein
MPTKRARDIGQIFAEGTLIDAALARGVREALRWHKRAGLPVVEWRNGRVRWVASEAIRIEKVTSDGRRGKRRH